jgi:hypothetical protein
MEKRFGVLRFIGSFYKIVGALLAILTVLVAIVIFLISAFSGAAMDEFTRQFDATVTPLGLTGGILGGLISAVVTLITGGLAALGTYALGEGMYLLLAMEENTRATALYMQRAALPHASPLQFERAAPPAPETPQQAPTGV